MYSPQKFQQFSGRNSARAQERWLELIQRTHKTFWLVGLDFFFSLVDTVAAMGKRKKAPACPERISYVYVESTLNL